MTRNTQEQGLTGPQIRAARGLLNISQGRLAKLAGVRRQTVQTIEQRETTPDYSGGKVAEALAAEGVQFIPGGARLPA